MRSYLCKIIFTILVLFQSLNIYASNDNKKILISQFVEHPALNKTTKGIIDGLADAGYIEGKNIDYRIESAQANSSLASQIASKFISQEADIIVGVATISAQSFLKYTKSNKAKLVFASVTDPIEAGLVSNIKTPGGNVSGVSNFVKITPQINLFKKIQPNLKKLGFLYNQSEMNSLALIKKLEEKLPEFGIELVLQPVTKTSEVSQASAKLANKVDAIFISNDNTALSALQVIINIAAKAKIPVYVSDTDAVKLGAIAAVGPNQYNIGKQTAGIIIRYFNGENIGDISVEYPLETELYLNEIAANKIGFVFDDELKKKASVIVGKS